MTCYNPSKNNSNYAIYKYKIRSLLFILNAVFMITAFNMNEAFSQTNPFGAGIIIGEPTGVSLKYWITGETAVDCAIAWSFSGHDSLHLHGDYLIHNFGLISVPEGKLPLYYGIGARYRSRDDDDHHNHPRHHENIFGARIPVGLAYLFAKIPVDCFIEIVPVLNLIPDTDLGLDLAIGARYFFQPPSQK